VNPAEFVVSSLVKNDKIAVAQAIDPHVVHAVASSGAQWTIGAFSTSLYEEGDLRAFLDDQGQIDCVVLTRNRDRFSGSALEFANANQIGMLHIRPLHAAIHHSTTFHEYLDRLTETILVKFDDHPNVVRVYRADSFRIAIERSNRVVYVVPMESYIATAAEVREKLASGTDFDYLVNLNPNGEDTSGAFSAAEEAGVRLIRYNQLWGLLFR
jgi:hypothetical protein